MNIVLTGPMGSGKTSIGRLLAKKLSYQFIDTDNLIETEAGINISEFFSRYGESAFRKKEEEIISLVTKKDKCVIATGGGVVLNPLNMRRLRLNGMIINLQASIITLKKRVSDIQERPLLKDGNVEEQLVKYVTGRSEQYKNNDFSINTDQRSIEEIVEQIQGLLNLPVIRICASVAGNNPEMQIKKANSSGASYIEFRLDLIPNLDINHLLSICALPVIITDRKNIDNLIGAIQQHCDYIDVDISDQQKEQIISEAKKYHCKVIVSTHDFEKTPNDFPIIQSGFEIIKIASMIHSKSDAYRLLGLLDKRKNLILIGMGRYARYVRLIAPIMGSFLTYASVSDQTGPGQMNIEEVINCYKMMGLK